MLAYAWRFGFEDVVSNPISGEVGAAAVLVTTWIVAVLVSNPISGEVGAAACHAYAEDHAPDRNVSNPISGEVGAAARFVDVFLWGPYRVSNPISGEVGAAASEIETFLNELGVFQTPSAGRWVLQRNHLLWLG